MTTNDPAVLPPGLPVPVDDGAADHLPGLALAAALRLPTFQVGSRRLYRRPKKRAHDRDVRPDRLQGSRGLGHARASLTLVARAGRVVHVFYPVFPPDRNAAEVAAWLRRHPA